MKESDMFKIMAESHRKHGLIGFANMFENEAVVREAVEIIEEADNG